MKRNKKINSAQNQFCLSVKSAVKNGNWKIKSKCTSKEKKLFPYSNSLTFYIVQTWLVKVKMRKA